MFEFYRECTFNYSSAISLVAICSALIALLALVISIQNLRAVKRAQCVQSHMNLISLENELKKNQTTLKTIVEKYAKASSASSIDTFNENEIVVLSREQDTAFELYISSVDKLASLINTEYLQQQFKGMRDWKDEYFEIFKQAKTTYDDYPKITIAGRDSMIRNLSITVKDWSK